MSAPSDILRVRTAVGVIIEEGDLSAADATDIRSRLTTAEGEIDAIEDALLDAAHPAWGIAWDGVTDDTAALQAFITHIQTNHLAGTMPARKAKISAPLTFSRTWGWSLTGRGRERTVIEMAADNQPIMVMASDAASFAHSWSLGGFTLTYSNVQPAANTNANCIALADMVYQGKLEDIMFDRGYYGIKLTNPAKNAPWGCVFDQLWFGAEMSGGCIDAVGASAAPNNHYGHLYVRADNMTATLFNLEGASFTIDNLEVNALLLGAKVMRWNAGSVGVIHAFKLEGAAWSANQSIIEMAVNCKIKVGTVMVYGDSVSVPSGVKVNVFNLGTGGGGGGDTSLDVAVMDIGGTGIAGTLYGFSGTRAALRGGVRCGVFVSSQGTVKLQDNGSTDIADALMVSDRMNNHMSSDKGNADYTVALTDPTTVVYQTAFTAPRTITLPNDGNNMHNGLSYRIVIGAGVVNGGNALTIKSGTTTLYAETAAKRAITYTWRRSPNAILGWVMTGYEVLP